MIQPELLEVLCCPETHQSLKPADEAMIRKINELIQKGGVKNRGGKAVTQAIEGGLVREDGKYLYLIRGKIPVMLIDEAIPLEGVSS